MNSSNPFVPSKEPIFSPSLREQLDKMKYGRWARDLSEDQLLAVLTAVGLFTRGGCGDLHEWLNYYKPKDPVRFAKQMAGLEIVIAAGMGRLFSQQEVTEIVGLAREKALTHIRFPNSTFIVRNSE